VPPRLATLAHLSDLHLGAGGRAGEVARRLAATIRDEGFDHVVVSGDVTHRGLRREYRGFREAFAPLIDEGRVTVVPGNHDRCGDDVGAAMMGGERVDVRSAAGAHLVLVDSTAPHNRRPWAGHGRLTPADLEAVDAALGAAPPGHLVALVMHHHPYELPEEGAFERLSRLARLPYAEELAEGRALIELATGRCDLVLHGHRHVPWAVEVGHGGRPLLVLNAGSSTALARFCALRHRGGELVGSQLWSIPAPAPAEPAYPFRGRGRGGPPTRCPGAGDLATGSGHPVWCPPCPPAPAVSPMQ
jgi:predicted phosphodiesterase